jgi:hypothetical protein
VILRFEELLRGGAEAEGFEGVMEAGLDGAEGDACARGDFVEAQVVHETEQEHLPTFFGQVGEDFAQFRVARWRRFRCGFLGDLH